MSSELAAVAAVLRGIADIARTGPIGRLRADIQRNQRQEPGTALRDPEVHWEVFPGMPGTPGAGAAVTLLAWLPDGRRVSWLVEVWIDTWEADGRWTAVVKGDVDRDLPGGPDTDEECLFLEQRTFQDVDGIGAAVREMAELVVAHPAG